MNVDRMVRRVRTARTYLSSASAYIYTHGTAPVMDDAEWLLRTSLEAAEVIIEKLPDDWFEEFEVEDVLGLGVGGQRGNLSDEYVEAVNKLSALLVQRRAAGQRKRRIRALENVEGRTPEEAALYQAKAEQLRRKGG